MRIDVHLFLHNDSHEFNELKNLVLNLTTKANTMSASLDALTAEVARNTSVDQSAIALLNGLKAKLDELIAAGNNDPALQSLADSLGTSSNDLAAAVAANTPAQP